MTSGPSERRPLLTSGQVFLLILAAATIVLLHVVLLVIRRHVTSVDPAGVLWFPGYALLLICLRQATDFYDVLWETELAIQMLAATWLLAAIGELVLAVHFIICNRLRARRSLLVGVTLLVLAMCFAPAVLVLVVGPSIARQAYQQEAYEQED